MTARRDPDRLIHDFLMEGQTELADPVYDAVRDRIEHTRQRAFIGSWRTPDMNRYLKIGLAAAAVVVIAVVAFNLLPGSPAPGVEPSATPEPTAMPTPSASEAAGLPVGSSHVLSDEGVTITVTIPAPGWDGDVGGGILARNDNTDPPDGAGMIVFTGSLYVYGDACQWSTTQADTPATTVDELVAALAAQTPRDASEPMDITVDGYSGKQITLHVPDDAAYSAGEFTNCDEGYFSSWGGGGDPSRWHQGPGQIDEVYILDVDGVLTVIDTNYYARTPAEDVEELRAIVESATFELP
jgi:hypothetical protein